MTGETAAALSVVVPSVNGWEDLEGCLAALDRERAGVSLELVIPERCGPSVRSELARRYPEARILPVVPGTGIPEMRARAFAAATAPTVAVIEDHVRVTPGWARTILDTRRTGARVLGGIVINTATTRIVDWAAFFTEYSQLSAAHEAGPAAWLTGNNVAYDRALLQEFSGFLGGDRWEATLHDAFRARGITLWWRPDLVAEHKKHYTVGGYLAQRFLYSRAFAGSRTGHQGVARRLGYGLLALGLPPLLLARITSRVWRAGHYRKELLRALPLLAVFVSGWALGETVGAWFGPGDALGRVS